MSHEANLVVSERAELPMDFVGFTSEDGSYFGK